jgi:hypothetical protein
MLTPAGYRQLTTVSPAAVHFLCRLLADADLSRSRILDQSVLARRYTIKVDAVMELIDELHAAGILERAARVRYGERYAYRLSPKLRLVREPLDEWSREIEASDSRLQTLQAPESD